MKRLLLGLLIGVLIAPSFAWAVPVLLTSGGDSTGVDDVIVTASISPTSNRPVLLFIDLNASSAGIDSVSGAGLTWTARTSYTPGGSFTNETYYIYTGVSASPAAGAITINTTNTGPDDVQWIILDLDGASTTPWVQSVNATGTSTSSTATLATFASASNWAISFNIVADFDTIVPEAGYTELTERDTFFTRDQVQYRADNGDLTPAATLGTSASWAAMAVEISTGGGGGGGSSAAPPLLNNFRMRIAQ
jgi:hypothetical protein